MSDQNAKRVHILYTGPASDPSLRYDPWLHDFIDEQGNLAPAERVAKAFGELSAEGIEQERRERRETIEARQREATRK